MGKRAGEADRPQRRPVGQPVADQPAQSAPGVGLVLQGQDRERSATPPCQPGGEHRGDAGQPAGTDGGHDQVGVGDGLGHVPGVTDVEAGHPVHLLRLGSAAAGEQHAVAADAAEVGDQARVAADEGDLMPAVPQGQTDQAAPDATGAEHDRLHRRP